MTKGLGKQEEGFRLYSKMSARDKEVG